jgi:hypothetical protein
MNLHSLAALLVGLALGVLGPAFGIIQAGKS